MEGIVKKNLSEGVPLNSPGAANIFLNTGKRSKVNDGTIIHLNTEKPADVGVHINTTLSIASSKKIKLLFILNFLLSVICMIISCSIGFYYWNEMVAMRRQLDLMRDQFLIQNLRESVIHSDKAVQSPLISQPHPRGRVSEERSPRMEIVKSDTIYSNKRTFYVDDLGEDILLVDSSKKKTSHNNLPVYDLSTFIREPLVVHFNGAMDELKIGASSVIGPWRRDLEVSTKNSETKIGVNDENCFTIQESGLYLIYTQMVYLGRAPNCYYVFASQASQPALAPRLLSACASGSDATGRPLAQAHLSCAAHTVARLDKDDSVYVVQREPNRTLVLKPGYTYFGFVKLSS